MKIISYNISDSYPWKVERLLQMQADILVVPEITCPEDANLPDDYEMCWRGINYFRDFPRWKGLGVVWKRNLGYILDWYNPSHFYAIPLIVGDILILAIWPTKREKITGKKTYPQIAHEILCEYAPHFKDYRTIVIGDFNCCLNQPDYSKQYGNILRINEFLNAYGLRSLYHEQTGEAFGKESTPTYYHHCQPNHPFFLDYAYTDIPVKSFRLLPWDKEMSDHVGMELEI